MHLMGIYIVIRQYWNIGISCIIESLPQQSSIMGQTAITYVFPHTNCRMLHIIFSASESGKGFSDDNLCRKTNVIMYILFSETDGFFSTNFQWNSANSLGRKGCGHHPAESMGSIGNQYNFFFPAFFCKFYRIRIGQYTDFLVCTAFVSHGNGFQKRTDTDAKRSLHITFIQFQNQRRLSGDFFHQTDNLIRKISIVTAAEAYDLDIFQMVIFRCQYC